MLGRRWSGPEGATVSIVATSIVHAGSARVTAGSARVTALDHRGDHDDEVRPLPSTEPSPGARPGRVATGWQQGAEGALSPSTAVQTHLGDSAPKRPGDPAPTHAGGTAPRRPGDTAPTHAGGSAPRRPGRADPDEVPVPARRAAHALMVMALEVVDRKRAPNNMRGAFPEHLVEMLRSLARVGVPGRQLGTARIHRLHIHPAAAGAVDRPDPSAGPSADTPAGRSSSMTGTAPEFVDYEVCATYARGPRLFAIAARIRVSPTGASCTALRLV